MKYRAKKTFQSITLGNFTVGQIVPVISERMAMQLIRAGLIELIEAEPPKYFAGPDGRPPLLSPAGHHSRTSSANSSPSSSRPADAELLQSTQAGAQCLPATSSMPATEPGGSTTTPKRRGRPKGGQQTRGAQDSTT